MLLHYSTFTQYFNILIKCNYIPGTLLNGEGNGTPLQYSCLETPRDGGAWWAAVYGVAQSRTRLKRLSCSSSTLLKASHILTNQPHKVF